MKRIAGECFLFVLGDANLRICHGGKSYCEGDTMEFRVLRCHHSHGVFYIEGAPVQD